MNELAMNDESSNPNRSVDIPGCGVGFEGLPGRAKGEVPEVFCMFTAAGLGQASKNYENFKVSAKEMTGAFEQAYSALTGLSLETVGKLIEALQINANAVFESTMDLAAAKSFPDLFERSTMRTSQQYSESVRRNNELVELFQKAALATMTPIATSVSAALRTVASTREPSAR